MGRSIGMGLLCLCAFALLACAPEEGAPARSGSLVVAVKAAHVSEVVEVQVHLEPVPGQGGVQSLLVLEEEASGWSRKEEGIPFGEYTAQAFAYGVGGGAPLFASEPSLPFQVSSATPYVELHLLEETSPVQRDAPRISQILFDKAPKAGEEVEISVVGEGGEGVLTLSVQATGAGTFTLLDPSAKPGPARIRWEVPQQPEATFALVLEDEAENVVRHDLEVDIQVFLDLPRDSIAVSYNGVCAIRDGDVYCWGNNTYGKLGTGNQTSQSSPVKVTGDAIGGVTHIAASAWHVCATGEGGELWCWGHGESGQLGYGGTTGQFTARRVPGGAFYDYVQAGAETDGHTCAIANGGSELHCWGQNHYSQLGPVGPGNKTVPTKLTLPAGNPRVYGLALGDRWSCAILGEARELHCWGQDRFGGSGDAIRKIPGASDVKQVGGGEQHICFVNATGRVYCSGTGTNGRLGNGDTDPRTAPTLVDDSSGLGAGVNVEKVVTATYSTCALTSTGDVWCWGGNQYGQLGSNVPFGNEVLIPKLVGPGGFQSLYMGIRDMAFGHRSIDGRLWGWGKNDGGRIFDDSGDKNEPVRIDKWVP